MQSPISIDPYSVCSTFVKTLFEEDLLSTASGFFWRDENNEVYLVSNWHVFAGRNPRTGQPVMERTGVVPNNIVISYHPKANLNKPIDFRFKIHDENETLWHQHRTHGQKVDVALMNISSLARKMGANWEEVEPFSINDAPGVKDMQSLPGTDVFILGYPLGITKTGLFPVWKRGSIATEFDVAIDGLPVFLVDTATREGMSGSPVIIRSFGGFSDKRGNTALGGASFSQFLGVYSGRFVGGIDEAQLGIIWKEILIREIINDPAVGDFEILS